MTAQDAPSLAEQNQEVRERLHAQRQRIALQLAPPGQAQGGFPRSMTMRLLIRRPDLIARLLASLASRLIPRRPTS